MSSALSAYLVLVRFPVLKSQVCLLNSPGHEKGLGYVLFTGLRQGADSEQGLFTDTTDLRRALFLVR